MGGWVSFSSSFPCPHFLSGGGRAFFFLLAPLPFNHQHTKEQAVRAGRIRSSLTCAECSAAAQPLSSIFLSSVRLDSFCHLSLLLHTQLLEMGRTRCPPTCVEFYAAASLMPENSRQPGNSTFFSFSSFPMMKIGRNREKLLSAGCGASALLP